MNRKFTLFIVIIFEIYILIGKVDNLIRILKLAAVSQTFN